ncbi:hypothetical protein E2542_SST09135 [Spatholobus suberectus]|nr:hypothetical protein E2542_SST09135 [Spatholobus suberectus]
MVVVHYPNDKDVSEAVVVAMKEENEGEAVIQPVPHKKGQRISWSQLITSTLSLKD